MLNVKNLRCTVEPAESTIFIYARLAQLGERLPYKQRVGGSSPSPSTICVALSSCETCKNPYPNCNATQGWR